MNQSTAYKSNKITKLLTSKFLLPIIFFILALSAFVLHTSFVKATPTGITQIGCVGCLPVRVQYPTGVAVDSNGNIYIADNGNHRIQKLDSSGTYVTEWGSTAVGSYGGSAYGGGNGEFAYPQDVAVDSNNNVYVVDQLNNRIQKFDSNGTFLTKWGGSSVGSYGGSATGTGNGEFNYPKAIAIDASNNVYVADTNNHRIQKFDSSGAYISQFGTQGSGNGEISYPQGVAVDSAGNVYVSDNGNNRIQKFDSSGNYVSQWGVSGSGNGEFLGPYGLSLDSSNNLYVVDNGNNRIQKFDSTGSYLDQWGSNGTDNGYMNYPSSVTLDSSGNIYVADTNNNRIQKFDSGGAFVAKYGAGYEQSYGGGNGQFFLPTDSTTDSTGNIYVADAQNQRIQKFDKNWNYLAKWGSSSIGPYGSSNSGGGDGEFYMPAAVAADSNNNIYVADSFNNRIQKFTSDGVFIAKWGSSIVGSYGGSAESGANGEFNRPFGIAIDSTNNVYVSDSGNNRIQKFTSDGVFITKWGSSSLDPYGGSVQGGGNGEFTQPIGISVDSSSNVYVADTGNNRIQKFDSNGSFIAKWGSSDVGPYGGSNSSNANGEFSYPYGVDVDASGNVYVNDTGNNRIQKLTSSGTYVTKYIGGGKNSYPLVDAYGIHAAGNGKIYVGTAVSAMVTLCDNDVSSDGCGTGSSGGGNTVVTVPNAVNAKPITIAQTGCTATTNASTTSSGALSKKDGTNSYPVGLVNFTLTGCTSGGSSTVTATFAGVNSTSGFKLRKYNGTNQTYSDVSGATLSMTTLSGEPAVRAVYSVTDGGPLDQDGTANGTIVDPVGLAAGATAPTALAQTGVLTISAAILTVLIIVSLVYLYFDYRRHKKPLLAIDPKVHYSFAHHMKVVTFPILRYRIQFRIQKIMPGKIHRY